MGSPDFEAVWAVAESEGWALDEDGNEVCPECWAKHDAAHPQERETP